MGIRHKARAKGHSDRQGEKGYRDKGRDERHLDNRQLTTHIINTLS